MPLKYKTIGLLDHMGLGNMGDAAILEAFIANIRSRDPRAKLVAFSLNPQDTKRRHGIEMSHPIKWNYSERYGSLAGNAAQSDVGAKQENSIARLKALVKRIPSLYRLADASRTVARRVAYPIREIAHLVRSFRHIRSLDVLVLSGGGQLCELWKDMPYNVFKFCLLAKLAGKPLLLVGIGAGPLDRPWNRLFGKWSVGLSDYTSFRDIESKILVSGLGSRAETHVCPDPAYSLDVSRYMESRVPREPYPKVGINLMGFCDPRIWPRQDERKYRSYLGKMHSFVLWLRRTGYAVEIFTSDLAIDRYAIEDLKTKLDSDQTPYYPSLTIRPVVGLDELLGQMSGFDFVVTSKFHGVVFSHLLSKPVISLSYHYKIDNLMRAIGHSEYCLEVEKFEVDVLMEKFGLLVEKAGTLRTLFAEAVALRRSKLISEFDRLFIPAPDELTEANEGVQSMVYEHAGKESKW